MADPFVRWLNGGRLKLLLWVKPGFFEIVALLAQLRALVGSPRSAFGFLQTG